MQTSSNKTDHFSLMTEQKSISSAVFSLKETLRKLQQQLPCLDNPAADTSQTCRRPNELHALGPFNLDEARNEFNTQISNIRDICSQFESEVLEDVMKMGAGADPAFRKHFTHLKEQAGLESTVMRVKETLLRTKEFFDKSQQEKQELKSSIIEKQQLQKIAHSLGLVTYEDAKMDSDPPVTTITLAGEVIVVDIDVDDTGRILETKVTYVSGTLQNMDNGVEKMLVDNLKNSEFDLFKRNLSSLTSLAQLNTRYKPLDFFVLIRNLFQDLKSIFDREFSIKSDVATLLVEGHGLSSLHYNFPGISVAYWMDKDKINQTNWEEVKTAYDNGENHPQLHESCRLLLSFETSIQLIQYLPSSRSSYLLSIEETENLINQEQYKLVTETASPSFIQPLQFVKPVTITQSDVQPIPLRFVFNVDPPLPASDQTCQQLLVTAGLVKANVVNSDGVNRKSPYISSSLSLEEMLIKDAMNDDDKADQQQQTDNYEWIHISEEMPEQKYHWKSSSRTSAKLITRIPFQHPVQIYSILRCLRQQQMFNTLFKSILSNSRTTHIDNTSNVSTSFTLSLNDILSASEQENPALQVEVVTLDAPNAIHITLTPPPSKAAQQLVLIPLSIEIPTDEPTKPVVILHPPPKAGQSWNSAVFDEAIMTEEIQTSHEIPSMIQYLYQKMINADYLLSSNKRRLSEDAGNISPPENKYVKMEIDEE